MRTDPDLSFERRLWRAGLGCVAGMDEAGRGALAGPVAVGAVVLSAAQSRNLKRTLRGVRDSKQMTPMERETAAEWIRAAAMDWCVGLASAQEIDSDGIVAAVRLAALRALSGLSVLPDYLLTDFRLELPEVDICQTSLVRGDGRCLSIAAASVLAKTSRDALMLELDEQIPGYGLARHKGYGTKAHCAAIHTLGPSSIHRQTFSMG